MFRFSTAHDAFRPAGALNHFVFREAGYLPAPSRAAPQLDEHGAPIAWIGVSMDIHELIAGQPDQTSITGAQISGARGILNWSVRELALAAGISVAVLRWLEGFDGPAKGDPPAAKAIRHALETGGIEFVTTALSKPGVRPR